MSVVDSFGNERATLFSGNDRDEANRKYYELREPFFYRADVNLVDTKTGQQIQYYDSAMDREERGFDKGGMMQGYNDRLDESLGNRNSVEPLMMQSYKDRRDESKGMEKSMGRRAYQSVGTMDKMAKGGEIETKREFVEVVNQVKEENEAFPNDFVNVMDSINAILQDRGYEEDDEYTYDVRQEILDRYEKKVLDKQGLRFAKGGKTQGDKFQVELHWKGLSKDRTIGKYIITEKTLDELEEQWSHIVSIDVLDNSNKKPISWFELKKELYSKGRDKGLYDKGGKTQGYNDKLDESLGNTKGKRSTKEQNYKDRRNESEAMEKKGGKRKYARVKTMDKGNRKKRKTPMSLAKEIRKEGEKWQDAVKRASAMLKKM